MILSSPEVFTTTNRFKEYISKFNTTIINMFNENNRFIFAKAIDIHFIKYIKNKLTLDFQVDNISHIRAARIG